MVVGAPQIDQHVALPFVVTDALDETAPRRVGAGKRLQVDDATVFNVYRLRTGWCGDQEQERRLHLWDDVADDGRAPVETDRARKTRLGGRLPP